MQSALNSRRIFGIGPAKMLGLMVVLGYLTATVFSFVGSAFWAFELLSHFRLQFFAGGFAIVLFLFVLKMGAKFYLSLVCALALNALPLIVSGDTSKGLTGTIAGSDGVRVMSVNFRYSYGDAQALQKFVAIEGPDVIVLTEIYSRRQELQALFASAYPHQFYAGVDHTSAMLILSRFPFVSKSAQTRSDGKFPIADVEICSSDVSAPVCFELIAMHTPRPGPRGQTSERNQILMRAANMVAGKMTNRTIVVGDFNITRWSSDFSLFLEQGKLFNSQVSIWSASTWISRSPLFGLSIDHILHGEGFVTGDRRVGPNIGSDHLPVVSDLLFDVRLGR